MPTPFRIGFFIDGFTFHKASDYYLHHHFARSRINIAGLKSFLMQCLREYIPKGASVTMEAHYYHPHENPADSNYNKSCGVYKFEEHLKELGFDFHYKPKNSAPYAHGNQELINDLKMFAHFEEIQLALLVTTQGFYVDSARFLRKHNIPLLLAGWDFNYVTEGHEIHWHTDHLLRKQAIRYFALEQVMERAACSKKIQNLFVNNRPR